MLLLVNQASKHTLTTAAELPAVHCLHCLKVTASHRNVALFPAGRLSNVNRMIRFIGSFPDRRVDRGAYTRDGQIHPERSLFIGRADQAVCRDAGCSLDASPVSFICLV